MHTKDMLATALREVGLDDMARLAESGYYHDYLSPLDLPEIQLAGDLALMAMTHPEKSDAIKRLRLRVIGGDFDATAEESDEWANSPEGQEAFRRLTEGS
jgi:hypothetical protein